MEFIKPGTQIPFVRYRHIAAVISTLVNIAVLVLLFTKGPNLGVDFAGGTMVHVRFDQAVSIGEVRQVLAGLNLGTSVVQDFAGGANPRVPRTGRLPSRCSR